jgi:chromosome partitioning protein
MDLAFVADKGGVGKTVLAYHVATRLKQLGRDVGLVDLDNRRASSTWLARGVPPYLPGYGLDDLAHVPDHAVRVWDTPAHPTAGFRTAIVRNLDLAVIVAEPDFESIKAAVELHDELTAAGGVGVCLLLNQVHPASRETMVEQLRERGLPVVPTAVRRYAAFQHCRWDGKAVCDAAYPRADEAWADICSATDAILELAKETNGVEAQSR